MQTVGIIPAKIRAVENGDIKPAFFVMPPSSTVPTICDEHFHVSRRGLQILHRLRRLKGTWNLSTLGLNLRFGVMAKTKGLVVNDGAFYNGRGQFVRGPKQSVTPAIEGLISRDGTVPRGGADKELRGLFDDVEAFLRP